MAIQHHTAIIKQTCDSYQCSIKLDIVYSKSSNVFIFLSNFYFFGHAKLILYGYLAGKVHHIIKLPRRVTTHTERFTFCILDWLKMCILIGAPPFTFSHFHIWFICSIVHSFNIVSVYIQQLLNCVWIVYCLLSDKREWAGAEKFGSDNNFK